MLDPFVRDEIDDAAAFGWGPVFLARSSTPLIVDDDVYVQIKGGTYVPCSTVGPTDACGSNTWDLETWGVRAYRWVNFKLTPQWEFVSDWKPEPDALGRQWEPLFQPAIFGPWIYVPGRGGRVHKVARATGQIGSTIASPLPGPLDTRTFVSGSLAIGPTGEVFYNVVALNTGSPSNDPRGSWLVKVSPDDTMTSVPYEDIATVPPALCFWQFAHVRFIPGQQNPPLPWPPSPDAVPPVFGCGRVRPSLNNAPVLSADGSVVYTLTRARANPLYGTVNATRADLTKIWSSSLRDRLHDGCGVLIPSTATDGDNTLERCRVGSLVGVDPRTNLPPVGWANDLSVSHLVVAPDGAILVGLYNEYEHERGHLYAFNADGSFRAAYNFGWNVTPAIRVHDGTYSIVMNDNQYGGGPYHTASLTRALELEWRATNTNDQRCTLSEGEATCDTVPAGVFDWISRQPVVDRSGDTWAASSDGNIYRISPSGEKLGRTFVGSAQAAADIPLSADLAGRLYVVVNGELVVLGTPGPVR